MAQFPYITEDLPGIGGETKLVPADFVVKEIPLCRPSGEGEHVYVCLTREGWTTPEIQRRLAALFGLREIDVGVAGLKDNYARATQIFSLRIQADDEKGVIDLIERNLPVEMSWVRRHRNKLTKGHLIGLPLITSGARFSGCATRDPSAGAPFCRR